MDLFKGIEENEKAELLKSLGASKKRFKKGSVIVESGERVKNIYYVEEGVLSVENSDYDGNVFIVSQVGKGGVFGGAFAFSNEICASNVLALNDVVLTVIPIDGIFTEQYPLNRIFIENLVNILATKCVSLITKIRHVSAKSIRGKVSAYLTTQAKRYGKNSFEIPFSRQELADYLGVDRSALSKELSLMQKDGVIRYKKNKFEILVNYTD